AKGVKKLSGKAAKAAVIAANAAASVAANAEFLSREQSAQDYATALAAGHAAADQAQLKGERVMDDTTAFQLEPWFDVTPPRVPVEVLPQKQ
ncbi:MAG: hypothetical protein ACOYMN_12270, partial [Roseimicrobium sp.]